MFVKRSWTYDRKKGKKYIGCGIVESYRPKRGKKRWPKTRTLTTITKPLIDKIALLLRI